MINVILFSIIVIAIIIISIMYLKSLQANTVEAKYNIVMRFLIVGLISIMFLENTHQTGSLKNISGTIQEYLNDAGRSMIELIDRRTKDIDNRLDDIDNKIVSIDKNVYTINSNVNEAKESIIKNNNNIFTEIQKYIDKKVQEFIVSVTPLGPGGIRTIW